MEKVNIVVPAAGKSSRFPNNKPKYLLYDYKGDLMIKNAVRPWMYSSKYRIVVGILADHNDKFDAADHVKKAIPNASISILHKETLGPADTVYQTLQIAGIDSGPLFIKDCDSLFECEVGGRNIAISNIDKNPNTSYNNLSQKSFVTTNENGVVLSIVEKEVVSSTFCIGGYGFQTVEEFDNAYESMRSQNYIHEVFVSDVIQHMMDNDPSKIFLSVEGKNYVDVGTEELWNLYNDKPVIFCDIDGTIMKAQSRFGDYSYQHDPIALERNLELIKKYENDGAQIIFVTARPLEYIQETRLALIKLGFEEPRIIAGLNNSRRILINDYNAANPFPRAEAVNIPRDSDTLGDFLKFATSTRNSSYAR